MSFVVDSHCHIFNADDVPVEGMMRARKIPGFVSVLIDRLLQGLAPGYGVAPSSPVSADDRAHALVNRLLASDDEIKRLFRDAQPHIRLHDGIDYITWAKVITGSRRRITQTMLDQFGEVDIFIPLMVDMELWLNDPIKTSIPQQIVEIEKLIRAFPGCIHPFAPFCPRRAVRNAGTAGDPLIFVKDAIENRGFIGVKLYPALGFVPCNNATTIPNDPESARYDKVLESLYEYCDSEQVPIAAHCSPGGAEAQPGVSGAYGNPMLWEPVLQKYSHLRLNLAHFGGGKQMVESPDTCWSHDIARLMENYSVYTDMGYFSCLRDDRACRIYLDTLTDIYEDHPILIDRMMYGTDWEMIAVEPKQEQYYQITHDAFQNWCAGGLPSGTMRNLFGQNAMQFLGLTDGEFNFSRLSAYYAKNKLTLPTWLSGAMATPIPAGQPAARPRTAMLSLAAAPRRSGGRKTSVRVHERTSVRKSNTSVGKKGRKKKRPARRRG